MDFDIGLIISELGETLESSGTDVQITWREWPIGTEIDPVTLSRVAPTSQQPITQTMTVKGFIHFPEPRANSQVTQFQEIELGDCILDLDPDVDIDGKDGISFLFLDQSGAPLDGQKWVPKPQSERLAKTWGMIIAGVKVWRTVLLRKAT